jgi:hypothetical protein
MVQIQPTFNRLADVGDGVCLWNVCWFELPDNACQPEKELLNFEIWDPHDGDNDGVNVLRLYSKGEDSTSLWNVGTYLSNRTSLYFIRQYLWRTNFFVVPPAINSISSNDMTPCGVVEICFIFRRNVPLPSSEFHLSTDIFQLSV